MTTFIMLRHGQTDWNIQRRYQGHTDIPLNAEGIRQAQAAREFIRVLHFSKVYCSDLLRAKETARLALGDDFYHYPIHYDIRLRERSFGTYEGGPYESDKMPPEYVKGIHDFPESFKFPEGESLLDVRERVTPFYEEMLVENSQESILIVSHGSLLSILACVIAHEPVTERRKRHFDNAVPVIMEY